MHPESGKWRLGEYALLTTLGIIIAVATFMTIPHHRPNSNGHGISCGIMLPAAAPMAPSR